MKSFAVKGRKKRRLGSEIFTEVDPKETKAKPSNETYPAGK